LSYQANHDLMTGLKNRFLFLDRLTQAIRLAQRKQNKLAVLFLDLDNFKVINDTLGHSAGDELIKCVSVRLTSILRKYDTVSRFGGDEFLILLDRIQDQHEIIATVERLKLSIALPITLAGNEYQVSCSIGISLFPDDADTPETLITQADIAMYRAKSLGRNNCQFYTKEMQHQLLTRINLDKRLEKALLMDEFVLHFQPQVSLITGKIVGLEALIRWQCPENGLITPAEFIPIAEESDLIIRIGDRVIDKVCHQINLWQQERVPLVPIAINIAASQFAKTNFTFKVHEALTQFRVEPGYLELELTESLAMKQPERTIVLMKKLKDIGVSLAIDDFGTGYSNLGYLKDLPADRIKLDKAFVTNIDKDSRSKSIAQAVISLSHSLGFEMVSEGVETEAQLDFLIANGCDIMQGYYFSKPLPEKEIRYLLLQGKSLVLHGDKHSLSI
jgi:diguanylate cyclase (GGDEF)-like protein